MDEDDSYDGREDDSWEVAVLVHRWLLRRLCWQPSWDDDDVWDVVVRAMRVPLRTYREARVLRSPMLVERAWEFVAVDWDCLYWWWLRRANMLDWTWQLPDHVLPWAVVAYYRIRRNMIDPRVRCWRPHMAYS